MDVEGYVTEEDPKLARLATRLGKTLHQIGPVGGYAVPFSPAELGLAQKG